MYQNNPGPVNYTAEGTADWKHWGLTAASDVNRKATGGSQISDLTLLGGATLSRFPGNPANWSSTSWSDGTPAGSATAFPGGVFSTQTAAGYRFTVPADGGPRVLRVYLGSSTAASRLDAVLSDGSAAPLSINLPQVSSADHYIVTINLNAPTPGAVLTVTFTRTSGGNGNIGLQGATLSAPFSLPFSDDFNDGNMNGWSVVDETPNASSWSVISGALNQTNRIQSVFAIIDSYHLGSFAFLTAGLSLTDYAFSVAATPLSPGLQDDIGVLFRYQDPLNYYRLTINGRYGFARLEKQVAGVFSPLATNARGYTPAQLLNIAVRVQGSQIFVEVNGDEIFAVTDGDLATGSVGLYTQERASYDNVALTDLNALADVTLSTPLAYLAQSGGQISATALARNVPAGGYVEFLLDGGSGQSDFTAPYSAVFNGVGAGNHTVEAVLRNAAGVEQDRDTNTVFGVAGDYIVTFGDSLTDGIGDTVFSDNQSSLGRIISLQGYQARLIDQLDASRATATNVAFNEGIGGDTTDDAAFTRSDSILLRHPEFDTALILLGTNDALASVASGLGCVGAGCNGTFKGNLQALVDKIRFDDYPTNNVPSGTTVYVAEVPPAFNAANPWTSAVNNRIRDYNTVVRTELVGVSLGPDFFDYFMPSASVNFESLFADTLHPNALGHTVMSALWHNVLSTPAVPLPFVLDALASTSATEPRQNLMEAGDAFYLDASFTLTSIPASLDGGRWIQVNNADVGATASNYISFTADRPVTVYVAFDGGATQTPAWLATYTLEAQSLATSNPNAPTYDLYSRTFAAGNIEIGGASASPAAGVDANLLVIVVEN